MTVWLGVDVGTVRIGVARSDATGLLATPLATLTPDRRGGGDVRALLDLVAEWEAAGVVVGLPVTLRGAEGRAAELARGFAARVREAAPDLAVEFVDERNTTVIAQRELRANGVRARDQKASIDARAAAVLLQLWLDRARATATPEVTTS